MAEEKYEETTYNSFEGCKKFNMQPNGFPEQDTLYGLMRMSSMSFTEVASQEAVICAFFKDKALTNSERGFIFYTLYKATFRESYLNEALSSYVLVMNSSVDSNRMAGRVCELYLDKIFLCWKKENFVEAEELINAYTSTVGESPYTEWLKILNIVCNKESYNSQGLKFNCLEKIKNVPICFKTKDEMRMELQLISAVDALEFKRAETILTCLKQFYKLPYLSMLDVAIAIKKSAPPSYIS